MLKISNLNVSYGAIHAIHDVSMEVGDGEIVSLIGANGAGKTTILHSITGLKKADSGTIEYNGQDLIKTEPSKIVTLGMAHVPEGRHVFPTMTVEENLEMGAYITSDKEKIKKTAESRIRMKKLSSGRNSVRKMPSPIQNRTNPTVFFMIASPPCLLF